MNQHALERIKEFSILAEQFQELWKTILIRAAWFEAEGAPRLLVLSIRFKPEDISAYPKPSIIPEVGPYKIAWEARSIAALKPTLVELAQGKINVDDVSLRLEYKSGSNWQETGSLFVAFECPGAYNPHDGAVAQLFMNSGDSATDQLYAPVNDRLIEAQWRSLPAPFWNRQDVMRNFFEITWGDQNQVAVHAGGSIPISFDGGTRVVVDKLEMGISLPPGADPKKVSVGMIAALFSAEPDLRSEIPTANWEKSEVGWKFKSTIDLGKGYRRVVLLLRYGGTPVERLNLIPIGISTSNAAIVAQAAVDPTEEFYTDGLFGKGKKPGEDFERAVAFLLGYCGFAVLPFGDIDRFNNLAPDILAASSRENVVLAVECTISSPNTNGKLNKLHQRCRAIEGRLRGQRLIPVLVTPLVRQELPVSETSMAQQDRVALVTYDDLVALNSMATEARSLTEIVRFIEKLRVPEQNSLFS